MLDPNGRCMYAFGPILRSEVNCMAASHSRPDLNAYSEAALMGPAELTGALREVLGAKLVAYLGGVSETRITGQWA